MIEIRDLKIGYEGRKGQPLLKNVVSCDICDGDFIAVVGPNGVGKSTLLHTLMGDVPPLGGTVSYRENRRENSDVPPQDILKMRERERSALMAVAFTRHFESPMMSVSEYVEMGCYRYNSHFSPFYKNEKVKEIVFDSLRTLSITHLSERNVDTLSDGEFQRVELARVLAQRPQVILLDEPTSHLDYYGRIEIMQLLQRLVVRQSSQRNGLSVVISTHELPLASQYCNQFWRMGADGSFSVSSSLNF